MRLVSRCALCEEAYEDIPHLFFGCAFKRSIWLAILTKVRLTGAVEQDLAHELRRVNNDASTQLTRMEYAWTRLALAATMYEIWNERNARIFEGRVYSGGAGPSDCHHADQGTDGEKVSGECCGSLVRGDSLLLSTQRFLNHGWSGLLVTHCCRVSFCAPTHWPTCPTCCSTTCPTCYFASGWKPCFRRLVAMTGWPRAKLIPTPYTPVC